MGSGSSNNTTVQAAPAASPEELEIQRKNSDILSQQLEAIKSQNVYQQNMFDRATPVFDLQLKQMQDQAALAPQELEFQKQQLELAKQMGPIQMQLMQKQLDQINQGYKATPEQSALIDEATNSQLDAGRSDIQEFSRLGLEQLRNELAPASGLRPGDTPITDRGFMLEREGTRQFGQLTSNMRTANANAKLNYPLAAAGVTNASSQFQQSLAQSIKDFQAQLGEQAAQNRLKTGLGVASSGVATAGTPGSPYGLTTGLASARMSGPRSTSGDSYKDWGIGEYGQAAAGIGAMMAASDRRLKTDISAPVGRMRKSGLPVYQFRYKGESKFRLGVMADEVERVRPDAVHTHHRGFKLVDYSKV